MFIFPSSVLWYCIHYTKCICKCEFVIRLHEWWPVSAMTQFLHIWTSVGFYNKTPNCNFAGINCNKEKKKIFISSQGLFSHKCKLWHATYMTYDMQYAITCLYTHNCYKQMTWDWDWQRIGLIWFLTIAITWTLCTKTGIFDCSNPNIFTSTMFQYMVFIDKKHIS